MSGKNPVYSDQLGMNVSTAQQRLVKMLLFEYGIKQKEDHLCYKCELPILQWNDASIDHIKPWRNEDNAQELFWDLENIALTHRKCNTTDRRSYKKGGPDGTWWCASCKTFKNPEEFGKSSTTHNGLNSHCLECGRVRTARYAAQNPRFPCPECRHPMRKTCPNCGWDLPMKDYMALRRKEGVTY